MSPTVRIERGSAVATGRPTSVESRSTSPGSNDPPPVVTTREQARRAGLVPVVVERRTDLVEQRGERSFERGAGPGDDVVGDVAHLTLHRFGGLERELEARRDRVGELAPTGAEHAHEPRDAVLVHDHARDTAAERDDALGAAAVVADRVAEAADQRERDQVDRLDSETGALDRVDQAGDRRGMRRSEQHLHDRLAGLGLDRPEDREVDDGLVERDRDELLGLEPQRTRELLAGHHRHLDLADDQPWARDPDAHAGAAEAELGAKPRDRLADRGGVDDLALAHHFARQGDLAERDEARRRTRDHLGDGDRVGTDVETDHAAGHESPPRTVCDSRYALSSCSRIRKCLPTRIAGNSPARMSRYTVMFETRMVSATSRTVRRRCSPATLPSLNHVSHSKTQQQQSSMRAST